MNIIPSPDRRRFMRSIAFGTAALTTPGLFAEELTRTTHVAEGPFYPDNMPLDTDNDLLVINDTITPAVGEVTHLSGRIRSASGEPMPGVTVEIWQVDGKGVYLHTGSNNRDKRDRNFQGFGRFLTDRKGQYYFRTVKPVSYPGRTPHIHFIVKKGRKRLLTTQMFINGHPQNDRDFLFRRLRDPIARQSVLVDFKPIKNSKVGELAAKFDIVLGVTPEDAKDERRRARTG